MEGGEAGVDDDVGAEGEGDVVVGLGEGDGFAGVLGGDTGAGVAEQEPATQAREASFHTVPDPQL